MKKTIIFILIFYISNLTAQNSLVGTWHVLNTSKQNSQFGQPDATFVLSFYNFAGYMYAIEFCGSSEIRSCSNLSSPFIYIPPNQPGKLPFTIESISNSLSTLSCGNTEVNKASQVCLKMFGGNEPQNSNLTIWVTNFNSIDGTCTLSCIRDEINGADGTLYSINLAKNFTADIKENDFDQVSIYPNPTSDLITITSTDALNKEYMLFDPQGRKVLSGTLAGTTTQLDLSKLARGNYLLQIGEKKTPIKLVKE